MGLIFGQIFARTSLIQNHVEFPGCFRLRSFSFLIGTVDSTNSVWREFKYGKLITHPVERLIGVILPILTQPAAVQSLIFTNSTQITWKATTTATKNLNTSVLLPLQHNSYNRLNTPSATATSTSSAQSVCTSTPCRPKKFYKPKFLVTTCSRRQETSTQQNSTVTCTSSPTINSNLENNSAATFSKTACRPKPTFRSKTRNEFRNLTEHPCRPAIICQSY